MKNQLAKVRERVAGICFVDDKFYPAVQAADMVAYESRDLIRRSLGASERLKRLTQDLHTAPHIFDARGLQIFEDELTECGA
jgi:hypothetical protein